MKSNYMSILAKVDDSSINVNVDGEIDEVVKMDALRMEVPVYQY